MINQRLTIRWLYFAHVQSICTKPSPQIEVWSGYKAIWLQAPFSANLQSFCRLAIHLHTKH